MNSLKKILIISIQWIKFIVRSIRMSGDMEGIYQVGKRKILIKFFDFE